MPRPQILCAAPLAAAVALLSPPACRGPEAHRDAADEEVYALIEARRAAFVADPSGFTVERPAASLRGRILLGEVTALGPLSLVECLDVAAENSRDFQDRREDLYLAALDLTLERWRFSVQEDAGANAFAEGVNDDGSTAGAGADLGLSKLFGSGAQVIAGLGLSTLRVLGSGIDSTETSNATLSITQPLLRGFGVQVVTEPLTQAERDLTYEVRGYERFRRTFAVDVATRYFRVLQQYDVVANQVRSAERLDLIAQRNEAFAEAGQLSEIQRDQAVQDKLAADNDVVEARQQLEFLLDDFKLFLGLPIEVALELDQSELARLREAGIEPLSYVEEGAIAHALEARLDHATARDRVQDAERDVRLRIDALRPGLSLAASAAAESDADVPLDYEGSDVSWGLDLVLDLPLDVLPDRNSYRAALISLEGARRAEDESADGIAADVRDELRDLAALRESHRIQTISRDLARRRVESTSMNFEAGRAETRDLLEAQDSLVNAENDETRALVDYYLASLTLWRDLEILRVDADGLHPESVSFELAGEGAGEERDPEQDRP